MIERIIKKRDIPKWFLGCLFFCLGNLHAQSPYFIEKKDAYYFAAGSAVLGLGTYLSYQTQPLTDSEILNLNADDINSFDRFAIKNNSREFKNLSDGLFAASFIAPIPLILDKRIQNDFWTLAVIYSESISLTTGTTLLTKAVARRSRPLVYNSQTALDEKLKRTARHSFFSGHTSLTAMNSYFFAKVFSDYYPDSKYKRSVWAAAILLPAATGYARVESGKHFPTDVIAGYAVGALIGYFVPYFHESKRKHLKDSNVIISPASGGVSIQLKLR